MIHRVRLLFVGAVVVALAIVGGEFPLAQLLHERAAIATTTAQLQRVQAENRVLAGQVAALHQPSTIARIAHQQYGLVQKGQSSVVVLPSPGSGGKDPLVSSRLPSSDLVPSDGAVANPASSGPVDQQGFWSKLLNRLEFWKATR